MLEERTSSIDGNREWRVTVQPAIEPITIEELKLFARIDTDDEDSLLTDFIETARRLIENYLGRALIQQTITLKMDFWTGDVIELPRPPLISITAVETLDESDTATTYDSSNYYIITTSEPGKLVIKQSKTYPQNTTRDYGGFQIRYLAGYGSNATDVPQAIRDGIKMWATIFYESRVVENKTPEKIRSLIFPYRIWQI